MIAELFPKNSTGYQFYKKYNNTENPVQFIEEIIGEDVVSQQEYLSMGFESTITQIGNEWLNYKNDANGAVKVFKYGLKLMPNNANLQERLDEAISRTDD